LCVVEQSRLLCSLYVAFLCEICYNIGRKVGKMGKFFMPVLVFVALLGVTSLGFRYYTEGEIQRTTVQHGDLIDLRVQRDSPSHTSGCEVHFSEMGATGIALLRAHEMPRSVVKVEKVDGDTVVATVVSEPYGELADFICPAGSTLEIDLRLAKEAKARTPKGSRRY
jgi:hypothetical protein